MLERESLSLHKYITFDIKTGKQTKVMEGGVRRRLHFDKAKVKSVTERTALVDENLEGLAKTLKNVQREVLGTVMRQDGEEVVNHTGGMRK